MKEKDVKKIIEPDFKFERRKCDCGVLLDNFQRSACWKCTKKKEKENKEAHLAELKNWTIEQRLERIERWIAEYKPPISMSDMRIG